MEKALTLSIVIPVFNEERHLRACLQSIARQTVMPDEVIVVDNNSTDSSVKVANEFKFVKVIHEDNQGIIHARNAGFNASKSMLIGRIDADVVLPSNWVEYVKEFYAVDSRIDSLALTGGGYFYNVRLPRINGWIWGQLAFRINRFILGHYILWGSNMVLPRQMWQAVAPNVCVRDDIHEDVDLAIHIHRMGYAIAYRESLRVGAYLKRVWSSRDKQSEHRARWPRTLKTHGFKLWWIGSAGNFIILTIVQAVILTADYAARIFGRPSLN